MTSTSWKRKGQAAVGIVIGAGFVAASVGLGIWAAAVYAPCAKPYAECAANGHAGRGLGGVLLILLTGAVGLLGLIVFGVSLVAFFSKPKTPEERRAKFEKKVAETKA